MSKLALSLPGFSNVQNTPMNTPAFNDAGKAISELSQVGLYVGGALMFFWAVWGVFDYIKGEGNKEALSKARKKIQWAIVGFVILVLTFFVSDFLQPILAPSSLNRDAATLTQ